jgi:hypothetical protein
MGMRFDLHLLGKPDEEGYAPTLRLRMLNVESLDEAVRIGMEGVSQARTPTAWGLRLFDELGREVYCWSEPQLRWRALNLSQYETARN